MTAKHPMIPFPVIVRAADGDIEACLLYTSDAADEEDSVDLGGRRIIEKNKKKKRKEIQI